MNGIVLAAIAWLGIFSSVNDVSTRYYPLVQKESNIEVVMVSPVYSRATEKKGLAQFRIGALNGIKSVTINGNKPESVDRQIFTSSFWHQQGENRFTVVVTDNLDVTATFKFHAKMDVDLTYHVPILKYHYIAQHPSNELYLEPELFDQQMKYLSDNGYHSITFAQLNDHLLRGTPLPSKAIIISFDDGYYNMYTNAYPILKKYGFVGSFGIITGKVQVKAGTRVYMNWGEIQQMSAAGMEMVSHTVNHKELQKLNDAELTAELRDSKAVLEQKLGKPVKTVIYPSGGVSDAVVKKAKLLGYESGRINSLPKAFESRYPSANTLFYLSSIGLYKGDDSTVLAKYLKEY